jgi:glycogen debranching enzyme GlgX/4-alpha-glucanotransferase
MPADLAAGAPTPLGVTLVGDGVNVAVYSAHARAVFFCLFDATGETELRRIPLANRTGDIFHAHVAGIDAGARYGLRAEGAFAPHEGHRFDASKLLVDPYALAIDRRFALHPSMFSSAEGVDSAPHMPKGIVRLPPPLAKRNVRSLASGGLIYELHVRGFSELNPDVPEALRGTFSGLAHPASIARLTQLGVTTIELLPSMAWVDERHLVALGLRNYWGYNSVSFLAPDPTLAPGGWEEVRASVQALHETGIEVVLDVVYNHTGEGDAFGPTLSLRGLDNTTYYRLFSDARERYIDDAGCGNCLALDRPACIDLAMQSLRAWARFGGVDGFRFDLATALGRRDSGFDPHGPLIQAIENDSELAGLRLIAEPWDVGPNGYQIGAFGPRWEEWNDRYRDDMRRFWRGDAYMFGAFATRFAGSSDLFGHKGAVSTSINYVTSHDGFTLRDLVSFNHKHNEANGENNHDGTNDNFSWNHGVEGATTDPAIIEARFRDERNLLATLLLSRGTPMLAMGSELGHSQNGNNNVYAQDNELSWIDWAKSDAPLVDFTGALIAFRAAHRSVRTARFLTGHAEDETGIPDVAWLDADGHPLVQEAWNDPARDTLLVALYTAASEDAPADRVLVAFHRGAHGRDVQLPDARPGFQWRRALDTSHLAGEPRDDNGALPPRSITVFAEVASGAPETARARRGVDPAVLDALSSAAGIAPLWWDIGGGQHIVAEGVRKALLAAMRLDGSTTRRARESLARLAEKRDLRALPFVHTGRASEPVSVPIRAAADAPARARWLRLERQDGSVQRVRINANAIRSEARTAADGRPFRLDWVELPPQPTGRQRLLIEDALDHSCQLAIAPRRCFLPQEFESAERRFGLSAHLYSLRDHGCHGIGDFSTLTRFARAASAHGAATIGLNPLHAMFAAQRDRASPYQPSDRCALDPIYIDLRKLDFLPESARADALIVDPPVAALSATMVDYPEVWRFKAAVLEQRFAAFEAACAAGQAPILRAEFEAFILEGGARLDLFARHEAIVEAMDGATWRNWPAALRDCQSDAVQNYIDQHQIRRRFYLFLQWLCDRQLAQAARDSGLPWGLLGDLAIGMAPDGAEAWRNRSVLADGASVGAPPDPLGPEGQNWSLPPLDPIASAAAGYAPFIEPIAANMRHCGALRIDHVLGLARLFWIPEGATAADGAYVQYPAGDLIGQIAIESQRARCLIVGEDLGTVPEGLRERLADAAMLSYRVLWFERDGAKFRPPQSCPELAMACVSTHDLPTLNGWWSGEDIKERRSLGLTDTEGFMHAMQARAQEKRDVVQSLNEQGFAVSPDFDAPLDATTAAALHGFLSASPARLMLAQADDLAGETVAVNMPGTDRERPNWRRRIAMNVEDIFESDLAGKILAAMAARTATPNEGAPVSSGSAD